MTEQNSHIVDLNPLRRNPRLALRNEMSSDTSFDALATLPGHISSFVADANNGSVIDTTSELKDAQARALSVYHLLQDVTHLLAKQHEAMPEDVKSDGIHQPGALSRVTVKFTDYTIGATVKADRIYGVQRSVAK